MIIKKKILSSVLLIQTKKDFDSSGYSQRLYDSKFFNKKIKNISFCDFNSSFCKTKGTIRGLHGQQKPFEEDKLFKTISGKTFHAVVDYRKTSRNYLKYSSLTLSEDDNSMLFVPKGFLHGFQSLKNNTLIIYNSSNVYSPENEILINYNDPYLSINWPIKKFIVSDKDKQLNFVK
jgi:dTDP-4-dehydrorhamnose 3,5-epimerase